LKPRTLKQAAAFLRRNYEKVASLFAPENVTVTAEALNQLIMKRAKALFPSAYPD
jgi:hypothetical protein